MVLFNDQAKRSDSCTRSPLFDCMLQGPVTHFDINGHLGPTLTLILVLSLVRDIWHRWRIAFHKYQKLIRFQLQQAQSLSHTSRSSFSSNSFHLSQSSPFNDQEPGSMRMVALTPQRINLMGRQDNLEREGEHWLCHAVHQSQPCRHRLCLC